jgi:hypothetical protein
MDWRPDFESSMAHLARGPNLSIRVNDHDHDAVQPSILALLDGCMSLWKGPLDGTGRRWRLTDDDILINEYGLFFLTEDDTRQAFHKAQYILKPLVVKSSDIQHPPRQFRRTGDC